MFAKEFINSQIVKTKFAINTARDDQAYWLNRYEKLFSELNELTKERDAQIVFNDVALTEHYREQFNATYTDMANAVMEAARKYADCRSLLPKLELSLLSLEEALESLNGGSSETAETT